LVDELQIRDAVTSGTDGFVGIKLAAFRKILSVATNNALNTIFGVGAV
jgi:hypothetical protein